RDQINRIYTYDAWNRLVAVHLSGGALWVSYSYDALGRRLASVGPNGSVGPDLYYSTAWQVIEEDRGGAVPAQIQYVWSAVYVDALVERDYSDAGGASRVYVQQDANWNVTAIVDATGVLRQRHVYDPYGQPSIYTSSWQSS